MLVIVLVALAVVALNRGASPVQDPSGSSAGSGGPAEDRNYADPVVVGRIQDPAVVEASGLAASELNAGVLWTHNDSGDGPSLYCLRITGESCGEWSLEGASAVDWEDVDIGPGPRAGSDYLYVGDIGDNERVRDEVTVYRAREPRLDEADPSETRLATTAIELRYPDRPHDAETLMVHPVTGDLYVVTKENRSVVFKATAPLTATETLEAVGTITIAGFLADRTGGDISPDGTHVVLCTYGAAYELAVPAGAPFDDIWKQPQIEIDVGARRQGEAITYSATGDSLFATSEGPGAPVYEIARERG